MWRWQLTVQLPFSLLQYLPLIFIGVRFGPAAATSLARRRFSVFEAWAVTRGRFWELLGSFALLWLIAGIALALMFALTTGPIVAQLSPALTGHLAKAVRGDHTNLFQRDLFAQTSYARGPGIFWIFRRPIGTCSDELWRQCASRDGGAGGGQDRGRAHTMIFAAGALSRCRFLGLAHRLLGMVAVSPRRHRGSKAACSGFAHAGGCVGDVDATAQRAHTPGREARPGDRHDRGFAIDLVLLNRHSPARRHMRG